MNELRRVFAIMMNPQTARQARVVDGFLVALLIAIALLRGLVWAGAYPALKVTDEPAHFDNIQYRAEHAFHAPSADGSQIDKVINPGAALELQRLWKLSNHYWRQRFLPDKRRVPEETELEQSALQSHFRQTAGQSSSLSYPGVYYALGVPVYRLFRTSSVLTRLFALRVYSILWGLVLVVCTFFAARWTLDSRSLACTAALFVCMQPMAAQQTIGVNNDAAMIGLGAAIFLAQLAILRGLPKAPSIGVMVWLAVVTALALETKPHAFALVPGTLILVAMVAWQAPRSRRTWILLGVGLATFLLLRLGCHLAFDSTLPHAPLPSIAVAPVPAAAAPVSAPSVGFLTFLDSLDETFYDYLFVTGWGLFCWLDFALSPEWLDALHLAGSLFWLGFAAAVAYALLRPQARLFWDRRLGAFAFFTAITGFLTILYAEYSLQVPGAANHVVQGRAFLIVAPAFAITGAISLGLLVPARLRGLATLIASCMILLLAFGALLTLVTYQYVG